ncbi:ABC transporter ATP-binding protein [Geotoga petraea]|uniref:ABC-2 type transport system ATP-binding protein n=1 Tax=Geotoga petraea TaxID=28234 RepID=A0A1G6HYM5_9BACT|nr:ABC transporter ATP-binding protein [Geotoga petraea]MDK2945362.1 type transport system ATP-binding protein [Geotoga sp.]SDB99304.1 ABC-2 type transport system ATP-binding protein [Geotoga petraea]
MNAIELNNLSKKFGNFYAVKDVDLTIKEGEIFGLLGPNGAGKSTIMKMISTLLKPTLGTIKINGNFINKNLYKVKKSISLVSDYNVLEDDLTPTENLKMFAEISNIKNYKDTLDDLMKDFGLNIYKNKLTKHLSSGNKQKLNIARALIKKPSILLLDEPTNAIDVETSRFIREYIIENNKKYNTTIIISSHYIWEVEQICNSIGVIVDGKIAFKDNTENIYDKFQKLMSIYEILIPKDKFEDIVKYLEGFKDEILSFKTISTKKIIVELKNNDFVFPDYVEKRKITPNLEDVYSYIVKKDKKL